MRSGWLPEGFSEEQITAAAVRPQRQYLSKRKLGRRDATCFKKLPHLDDFLFSQVAMSVPERGGMSMELHADSIAKLIVHLCPDIPQEMQDLFEIDIRADRMGE
jgi:hypothetical protein